jgi:asparagine synthase (glutamine-hydrolysing)
MCGICGVVQFAGAAVDPQRLRRACARMRHRGPDDWGIWIEGGAEEGAQLAAARQAGSADPGGSSGDGDARVHPGGGGGVGLGAVRLAVLDPSPAGHQPMHRAGVWHIAFNGEIYNFREIRHTLIQLGETFRTDTDTEVLLAACGRWGVDALARLNGMWAAAFFDSRTGRGFLARDRFGIKPVVYAADGRRLAFGSEVQVLAALAPELTAEIDPTAVTQHLTFGYIAAPRTIHSAMRRLPPGHYLPFDREGVGEPTRYYDPIAAALEVPRSGTTGPAAEGRDSGGRASGSQLSYGEACGAVRRAMGDAVTRRRVADVPLGALLSGGLDSSIVVAHLARATGRRIQTFCVGYPQDSGYDERAYARLVADRYDTEHHEILLTSADVFEAVPKVLDHLGEPVGDSSILPTSLVSQFARQRVTVALSGDGADELFAGYWRYLGHEARAMYRGLPGWLRRFVLEPLLGSGGQGKTSRWQDRRRQFRKLLRGTGETDSLAAHLAWSRILSPEMAGQLLDEEAVDALMVEVATTARDLTAGLDRTRGSDGEAHPEGPAADLARILAFDLQYPLPSDMLHKVDQASMMHSLEVRVPMLDPAVVELAVRLPASFKLDRGVRKRLLLDAYRPLLPAEILERPKKGFEVPIGEFLRGPLREMFRDTVTPTALEAFEGVSFAGVEQLYDAHCRREAEHADVLFALLSLCWWRGKGDQIETEPPASSM